MHVPVRPQTQAQLIEPEAAPGGASATLRLRSQSTRVQDVVFTTHLLREDNPLLRQRLAGRRPLVVCTPTVERVYGRQLRAYLATLPRASGASGASVMVLDAPEQDKTMPAVLAVCERATEVGLGRLDPIVALGGGVCTDVCGLAAALYRRGTPHFKIPTTLVGIIDAGIGTKNAVNCAGRKNGIGSFHPPECSILDPGFLRSLPRRDLANGMAEIIKLAITTDAGLFAIVQRDGGRLIASAFRDPEEVGRAVLHRAAAGMLQELSQNLYEDLGFERPVDFGHTFSPHLEMTSGGQIRHGEAVALDIALSCQLASDLGLLSGRELEEILTALSELGLRTSWSSAWAEGLWASTQDVVRHRNGALNLVVPTTIGTCAYLGQDDISPGVLERALERLGAHRHASGPVDGRTSRPESRR